MTDKVGESFDERLNYLIANVHPKDRGPYTDLEVARGVTEHGFGALSKPAVVKHRKPGANPTLATLKMYAEFFGVPVSYFTDNSQEARRVVLDLQNVAVLQQLQQDTDMAAHLERYGGLSSTSRRVVADLSERLRAIEEAHRATEPDDSAGP